MRSVFVAVFHLGQPCEKLRNLRLYTKWNLLSIIGNNLFTISSGEGSFGAHSNLYCRHMRRLQLLSTLGLLENSTIGYFLYHTKERVQIWNQFSFLYFVHKIIKGIPSHEYIEQARTICRYGKLDDSSLLANTFVIRNGFHSIPKSHLWVLGLETVEANKVSLSIILPSRMEQCWHILPLQSHPVTPWYEHKNQLKSRLSLYRPLERKYHIQPFLVSLKPRLIHHKGSSVDTGRSINIAPPYFLNPFCKENYVAKHLWRWENWKSPLGLMQSTVIWGNGSRKAKVSPWSICTCKLPYWIALDRHSFRTNDAP